MSYVTSPSPAPSLELGDLVILADFAAQRTAAPSRRRSPLPANAPEAERIAFAIACQRLVQQCALVPRPRQPGGYDASLIGLSRLHRLLNAPLGKTDGISVDEEIRLRRHILDRLDPPDRREIERRLCVELVEMRAGVFRCAHADLCAGRGCPFEAALSIDDIDRALCRLMDSVADTGTS